MAGVAIGSRELYDALPESEIDFRPVSFTHCRSELSKLEKLVTINSALQVDLYGQVYSEVQSSGWMWGSGGVTDFVRDPLAGRALRIIVLPSTACGFSRLIPPGAGQGPVTLNRMQTDLVITEFGAADLRGQTHTDRARALVDIANPDFREELLKAWFEGPGQY